MTINDTINYIIAGGLLGALGQGIRVVVGLKKLNQDNNVKAIEAQPVEEFSVSRLLLSIFIGFVAGAIGMLIKNPDKESGDRLDNESIIAIIAIGYSGADFIEGVFNTYIKKTEPTSAPKSLPGQSGDQPLTVPDEANFQTTPAQG